MKPIINTIFPPKSTRRKVAGQLARRAHLLGRKHPDIHYAEWQERTEPFLWSKPNKLNFEPQISIVTPVFNSPAKYLLPMVYSVINQRNYDNWELVLVNASTNPRQRQLTDSCAQIDSRIKVYQIDNLGIAGNTDFGIKLSQGQYVGLLDHDDTLAPNALHEVAKTLQKATRPQLIYSDEDKLAENGEYRFDPFFKPSWSPHLLKHVNYLNHFAVVERKLLESVGGYEKGFEGAQDFELFLRLVDAKPIIAHVPRILYHWRVAHGSTAHNFNSKKNIRDAGVLALQAHLERNNVKGKVQAIDKQPGFYKVIYQPKHNQSVAIIVLPSLISDQYEQFVEGLPKTIDQKIKFEIYAQGKSNNESKHDIPHIHYLDELDRQAFLKQAIDQTGSNIFVIINCAFKPLNDRWLSQLTGLVSQNASVAVASPLIIDKNGDVIVDAGMVNQDDQAIKLFEWLPLESNTYFGNTLWGRNLDFTTNRVNVMTRKVYQKYFSHKYPSIGQGQDIYKNIDKDGLEIVLEANVQLDFFGDFELRQNWSRHFSPSLVDQRRGISLPKTSNIPPGAFNEKP